MMILAEMILERDKKRGRQRSHRATPRTSDAVAVQNRPAPLGEARLLVACGVASPRRTTKGTSLSARLACGQNSDFQNHNLGPWAV